MDGFPDEKAPTLNQAIIPRQDIERQSSRSDEQAPQQCSPSFLHLAFRVFCYAVVFLGSGYIMVKGFEPSTHPRPYIHRPNPFSNPDPLKDLCINFNSKIGNLVAGQSIAESTQIFSPNFDFNEPGEIMTHVKSPDCGPAAYTKSMAWGFYIRNDDYRFKDFSLLDLSESQKHSRLQGEITVERGTDSQQFDIETFVTISSSRTDDIDSVQFYRANNVLYMGYNPPVREEEVCTDVQLVFRLRPGLNQTVDNFRIWSDLLDVWFKPSLGWKVNNLSVGTRHGDIAYNEDVYHDPLTARNISMSAVHGSIFGCYIPDENLNISNEKGHTDVVLVSNLSPNAPPFNPQNISITSKNDIRTVTAMKAWPKQSYTHRTNIHTKDGILSANVPHGSFTNITSNGFLSTLIMPMGKPSADGLSEIYTNSRQGGSSVYLTGWFLDHDSNALTNVTSEHRAGDGSLFLRYADIWAGEMEAEVKKGYIYLDEWEWKIKEESRGYVKAVRGDGTSRMRAYVENGDFDVMITH